MEIYDSIQKNIETGGVDADMMLWIKDRTTISDKTYKLIYTLLDAPPVWIKFSEVVKARERWNKETRETFKIAPTRGEKIGVTDGTAMRSSTGVGSIHWLLSLPPRFSLK